MAYSLFDLRNPFLNSVKKGDTWVTNVFNWVNVYMLGSELIFSVPYKSPEEAKISADRSWTESKPKKRAKFIGVLNFTENKYIPE